VNTQRPSEAVNKGKTRAAGSCEPEASLGEEIQPVLAEVLSRLRARCTARNEATLAVPSSEEAAMLDAPLTTTGRADAVVLAQQTAGTLCYLSLHRYEYAHGAHTYDSTILPSNHLPVIDSVVSQIAGACVRLGSQTSFGITGVAEVRK
jgi:hypothetical protein